MKRWNCINIIVFEMHGRFTGDYADKYHLHESIERIRTTDAPGIDLVSFILPNCTYIITYRSPSSSIQTFMQALDNMLRVVEGPFLLLGDINIDLSVEVLGGAAGKFLQIMHDYNAVSLTRLEEYSTDGKSHIDVAFSNCNFIESWYYETYFSYHKPICSIVGSST